MKVQSMKKMLLVLGVVAIWGVAGCGGSGAGAGGTAPGTQAATSAQTAKVSLSASSQQLTSDGSAPVELTAVVTDAVSGVALAGRTVAFAVRDAANGVRIEVTRAVTDASGIAVARLLLNGNSTERDVTVLASVDQQTPAELVIRVAATAAGAPVQNNSRGELNVRLGTDNLIEDLASQLSYRKRYAAIVTDNAGIPKAGVSVLATLRSRKYYVGYWGKNAMDEWVQIHLTPAGVASEDVSDFGTCNPGEDANGDKLLTPGNIASYTVVSQTDANGVAVLDVVYLKSFAQWAQMQLEVTASVGGTEAYNALTIQLPILAADVSNAEIAPPSTVRTRESLGTPQMPLTSPAGDEGAAVPDTAQVAGSPFPYQPGTPTCP